MLKVHDCGTDTLDARNTDVALIGIKEKLHRSRNGLWFRFSLLNMVDRHHCFVLFGIFLLTLSPKAFEIFLIASMLTVACVFFNCHIHSTTHTSENINIHTNFMKLQCLK